MIEHGNYIDGNLSGASLRIIPEQMSYFGKWYENEKHGLGFEKIFYDGSSYVGLYFKGCY